MNDSSQRPNESNRGFDWGPPVNSALEAAKEWLVYMLLVVLLAVGAWILLDINEEKIDEAKKIVSSASANIKKNSEVKSGKPEEPGRFLVQLGAFADKKSATEAFEAMKAAGFSPVLSEPDSQYEIYRVSVGPFQTEDEANETADKLNSLDFHCFVIESL